MRAGGPGDLPGRLPKAALAIGGLAVVIAVAGCGGHSRRAVGRSSATALAPVSEEVHQAAAEVWPAASGIWPGTVLKDRRIILGDGKETRLISVDGVTRLSPADLARKNVTMPAAGSAYTLWEGHPAVSINAADPVYLADAQAAGISLASALFGAATDELFHASQQDWKVWKDTRQIRGTEYPLSVTPRLYRAMIYNDLLAAYRDPKQRSRRLAAAAYWQDRWHREFPDEARRAVPTDIAEGAAGYFNAVARAVGMGVDRDDRGRMRAHAPFRPLGGTIDPRRLTLDGEGTALGGVAGLLLDETRKDWKKEVAQARQTPVGLALAGATPTPEQPPDELRRSIQDVLAKQNSDLIPRLTPLVTAYHDTARPLLLVPLNSADGDLDAGGYYVSRDVPYPMLARLSGTFRLPGGTLQAKDASVFAGAVGGHSYLIVPIEAAGGGSRVAANRVRLRTGTLSGDLRVTAQGGHGRTQLIAR